LVGGDKRGAVLRLHGGVGEERHAVVGLDAFGGLRECVGDIAIVARDARVGAAQAVEQAVVDRCGGDPGGGAVIPHDRFRQRVGSFLRAPPAVRHHRHHVRISQDTMDALHAGELGFVDGFQRAFEHRALDDGGVEHVRQAHVDGVDRRAYNLVGHIEAALRRADQFPVFRFLQLDLRGRRHRGGRLRDAAERDGAASGEMGDDAARGGAFRARHVPPRSRRCEQHLARRGAGAPQIVLRGRDGAAGAGRHVAPGAVAAEVLARRHELGLHLAPVAFELFGDQHGQCGEGALAHLGAGDADDHGVVGLDHDPGGDLRPVLCSPPPRTEGNVEAERERAADRGDALEERAAVETGAAHGERPTRTLAAAAWIAARMR
jgi:hypothetical protein